MLVKNFEMQKKEDDDDEGEDTWATLVSLKPALRCELQQVHLEPKTTPLWPGFVLIILTGSRLPLLSSVNQ